MSAWTDLGSGILVRQSVAFWMNSGLLLDRECACVIDPGVLPSELDDLARAVTGAEPERVTLVLTHAHWDHVLGRPWWPDAETLAHDRFAVELGRDREKIEREAGGLAKQHAEPWTAHFQPFRPTIAVSGLRFMKLGPWRVVLRDAFGHCDSQLSLHLPERRVLFAADMLSDIEPPILNRPCEVYRATLETLLPLFEGGAVESIVPGHGAIALGRTATLERLHRDLEYLETLESGVREARQRSVPLEEARQRLSEMDYTGKHSSVYPTLEFHLRNIKIAYEGFPTAGD